MTKTEPIEGLSDPAATGYIDYTHRLKNVDPRLIACLVNAAHVWTEQRADGSFVRVVEGVRSKDRQRELVALGKSKTMRSYHLKGRAVDIALFPKGEVTWKMSYYEEFDKLMQNTALGLGIILTWGGSWARFKDGVHWQIELPG